MNAVNPFTPIPFHQRGGRKVVVPADDETIKQHVNKPTTNRHLINAIARAFYWARLIDLGIVKNGSDIAKREGLEVSTVNERLRLSLLAPEIIEKILNGTQPESLTMQWLTRNSFPSDWQKQKLMLCAEKRFSQSMDRR